MEVMFLVMFVCLSVRPSDYLQSNERIRMTCLPEVCLGPRTEPLNFVDDFGITILIRVSD